MDLQELLIVGETRALFSFVEFLTRCHGYEMCTHIS